MYYPIISDVIRYNNNFLAKFIELVKERMSQTGLLLPSLSPRKEVSPAGSSSDILDYPSESGTTLGDISSQLQQISGTSVLGYGPIGYYEGSSPPEEEEEPTQIGSYPGYKLMKELGKGHFGTVYEAIREKDGKTVALKAVTIDPRDPEALPNLMREVSILIKISDPECQPFLVCFHGYKYLEDQNVFLIDMDLVEGQNLLDYKGNIHFKDILYRHLLLIMKDLVEALQYLHRNGIVHNDVKPDNIIIDKNLTPVLVDMGVACSNLTLCQIDETNSGLCCRGAMGPVMYVSPERIKTKANFPQSDIWSMGMTFYVVATGTYPFDLGSDPTPGKLLRALKTQEPKKLQTSNEVLNYIVNRSLDKNPVTRIGLDEISQILDRI